jgi:hypothetical protein
MEGQMIKPGVDLRGLTPQMAIAYTIACAVYQRHCNTVCTITSASDGKHGVNSLHYKGKALDLRTFNVPTAALPLLVQSLKDALGAQFDVVLEADHVHIEWDVKDEPKIPEEA